MCVSYVASLGSIRVTIINIPDRATPERKTLLAHGFRGPKFTTVGQAWQSIAEHTLEGQEAGKEI